MRLLLEVVGGLTMRGRAIATAGLLCGSAAYALGSRDLLRVGAFLLVLPLVAALLVARTRQNLTARRSLDPPRVSVGEEASVELTLATRSRLPAGALLLEDRLPYALGGPPRFVLERLEPGAPRRVGYTVTPAQRGRARVGPLLVRMTDPFGLCELPRAFPGADELVVAPAVEPLGAPTLPAGAGRDGEGGGGGVAISGQDDAALREYRTGDDLRRVHWRASARLGDLVVRREEQPRQTRAAVLLDLRASAHTGDGRTSTLELGITAAASVVAHLAGAGWGVRLLGPDGREIAAGTGPDVVAATLDQLAVAEPERTVSLDDAAEAVGMRGEGLVVAVLGGVRPEDLATLARTGSRGASRVALVTSAPGRRALSADASVAGLRGVGWSTGQLTPGASVASAWASMLAPQPLAGAGAGAGGRR